MPLEITFGQFVTFLTTPTDWVDGMPLDARQVLKNTLDELQRLFEVL